MSNIVLTLGDVAFKGLEVPQEISFGGKQRVVVQSLIGGGRVVSALGIDDGAISFSGIFSGQDAASRAQTLDVARALGAALPLVWDGFFYSVIISQFNAEYRRPNLIPFTIHCEVVTDPLADLAALTAPLANIVGNDLTIASALSGQAGVSLSGLAATSLAGFATVQNAISAGLMVGGLAQNADVVTISQTTDSASGINAVGQLSAVSGQLAGLSGMSGYVNRAAQNIAGALL